MIGDKPLLSGRLGRIEFAMSAAAFFCCKIGLLYLSFIGMISTRISSRLDLILLIVLILIPAALRFHDFNRSAKWPVLFVVVGSTLTIVTTVLVVSAAQTNPDPPEISLSSLPLTAQAFMMLPFFIVMVIGILVPGTAGTNRFGEPAKSVFGGAKRSD